MQESAGKKAEREIFFNECLPSWLLPEQLQAGNFLFLLGRNPEELRFTDALHVDRSRVWSVEERLDVYQQQFAGDWGVSLYYGTMAEYLERMLHGNQAFLVLRLDVEGSYLIQIDPAMTSVLLFCWRNPETVIASYASIGRDRTTLYEGVKSLAWFLRLAPDATKEFFRSWAARYQTAGFSDPVRMVLRDLLWLRSNMEHDIVASAAVGVVKPHRAQKVLESVNSVWQNVVAHRKLPLRLSCLADLAQATVLDEDVLRTECLGLEMSAVRHVIYNAKVPWSQRCYFTKWRTRDAPVDCATWAADALKNFTNAPLTYIDHDGVCVELRHEPERNGFKSPVIWNDMRVYTEFVPRRMSVLPVSPYLLQSNWTVASIRNRMASTQEQPKTGLPREQVGRKEKKMATQKPPEPAKHFMRGNILTDYGKEEIRRLAGAGMLTEQIQAVVPASVPRQSIIAMIAIAHRKKK